MQNTCNLTEEDRKQIKSLGDYIQQGWYHNLKAADLVRWVTELYAENKRLEEENKREPENRHRLTPTARKVSWDYDKNPQQCHSNYGDRQKSPPVTLRFHGGSNSWDMSQELLRVEMSLETFKQLIDMATSDLPQSRFYGEIDIK